MSVTTPNCFVDAIKRRLALRVKVRHVLFPLSFVCSHDPIAHVITFVKRNFNESTMRITFILSFHS